MIQETIRHVTRPTEHTRYAISYVLTVALVALAGLGIIASEQKSIRVGQALPYLSAWRMKDGGPTVTALDRVVLICQELRDNVQADRVVIFRATRSTRGRWRSNVMFESNAPGVRLMSDIWENQELTEQYATWLLRLANSDSQRAVMTAYDAPDETVATMWQADGIQHTVAAVVAAVIRVDTAGEVIHLSVQFQRESVTPMDLDAVRVAQNQLREALQ